MLSIFAAYPIPMKHVTIKTFAFSLSLLLMFSCNSNTNDGETRDLSSEDAGKEVNTGTMKVGYVNTDSLSANYELIKDVQDEIIAEQMRLEGQYQILVQGLQRDFNDAQAGSAGLSQEALAILQQKLAQKEQDVMMQKSRMENQLMELEQTKTEAYLTKVQTFISDYAKSNGYDIIYGFNGLNNLLYIDKGYDVTKQVLDALNESYRQEKETANATE